MKLRDRCPTVTATVAAAAAAIASIRKKIIN
jgi:hypothetical protein